MLNSDTGSGMKTILFIGVFFLIAGFSVNLRGQNISFGDLIPGAYLPPHILPTDPLNCLTYFRVVDSINQMSFHRIGRNILPTQTCGNDSLSFYTPSILEALQKISPDYILIRLVLDREGHVNCCKSYSRDTENSETTIEQTFAKMSFIPVYLNGRPVPSECRYLFHFQTPKLSGRKVID